MYFPKDQAIVYFVISQQILRNSRKILWGEKLLVGVNYLRVLIYLRLNSEGVIFCLAIIVSQRKDLSFHVT